MFHLHHIAFTNAVRCLGNAIVARGGSDYGPFSADLVLATGPRLTADIRNARFAEDQAPLDATCGCPVCGTWTRAYLHHLIRANESLGGMLLTWNNLSYYQDLMAGIRKAIEEGRFADFMAETQETWARGDLAPL